MTADEWYERGTRGEVARSIGTAREMVDKLAAGDVPVVWLSGPGGVGKSHAAHGAIERFRARGLEPVSSNPSSYRDVQAAFRKAKVHQPGAADYRLIFINEADVIFRSDKCLNLLKVATDRAGIRRYDGVDVSAPLIVTTNAPIDKMECAKSHRESIAALFNRVPPITITFDRRANADYAIYLALFTPLLRWWRDGKGQRRQIQRQNAIAALEWFRANYSRLVLPTGRTLLNASEYHETYSPDTRDVLLQRLLGREYADAGIPPQSWDRLMRDARERQ